MDEISASTAVLVLVSFLQVIFMFAIKRIYDTQDKLYSLIAKNKDKFDKKLEDSEHDAKEDRRIIKVEQTALLEKHYVTTGQLNTLEEKLVGQIRSLSISIEHLTDAIRTKFKDDK